MIFCVFQKCFRLIRFLVLITEWNCDLGFHLVSVLTFKFPERENSF